MYYKTRTLFLKFLFCVVFYSSSTYFFAQTIIMHPDSSMKGMDMSTMDMDNMQMPPMSNAFSKNLPMNRNGSGTGWSPDSTPMYGYMLHSKKWMFMTHGNIFLRYNNQDVFQKGDRGGSKFDAVDWFMFM